MVNGMGGIFLVHDLFVYFHPPIFIVSFFYYISILDISLSSLDYFLLYI